MAVKISESEWSKFTDKVIKDGKLDPKLKLDDAALSKALAAYDKTDASKPEPHLKALDELIKQIPEQVKALVKRKKELGDKPFGQLKDQLYELLEAAEGQRKTAMDKAAEAKAAESKGKSKGKDDEDDEADTPALLNTKMVPLLRELRKGETQMHAVICTAGKNTAVLIMRRPISKSRYPLLAEAVDAKGGMKYIVADCLFELQSKLLTFVVKSPGAQLAKRVRQALLDQTQLRFRVKVRGEDGVEENDGEDEGDDQAGVKAQAQKAPPGGPASAEQLAYTQRLLKVRERYDNALKQQHPEATKLRALMGLVSEQAGEKSFAAAIQSLQALEKLLVEPTRTQDDSEPMVRGTTKAPPMDPAFAFRSRLTGLVPQLKAAEASSASALVQINAKREAAIAMAKEKGFPREKEAMALLDEIESLIAASGVAVNGGSVPRTAAATGTKVIFQQTRLAWDATRSKLKAEVKKLEDDIRARCTEDPDVGNDGVDLSPLSVVLERLDSRLMDKLDEALNAEDPAGRQKAHSEAKTIVADYMAFVNGNELMADIDDSGFVPVTVRETALNALTLLASKL